MSRSFLAALARAARPAGPPPAVTTRPLPPQGETLGDVVVRAAGELVAEGVVLTLPSLSVRCWRISPDRFGLGTTPHPDSARVNAEVAKLVARGLLARPEMAVLTLTEAGRRAIGAEATP